VLERTTIRTVLFERPFKLPQLDTALPPGTYTVETDEELVPGLSFTVYRRVRTTIVVPSTPFGGARARQVVSIEPEELDAALLRDSQAIGSP